ncbi:AAA family ATPase [Azorhizobium doebereinerae]|uniref:AAA family ATPase n=1 Tax=Azorhizobium doebereinerae TaxID=281091 RepID=UPI0003FA6729|nr:AAA family ATPase [Azorhizobium doebereinerae]
MNAHNPETTAKEALDALRTEVRLLMGEEGLTQADIAKEAGIAYGTFTPWMGDTYQGNNVGIGEKVSRWLETRRERKRTRATLPVAPGYLATPTSEAITNILSFAQVAPDFGVIVGGAGIGKTTTIQEYQRRAPNVHVVTGEPCLSSPNNMLAAIAEAMGVIERSSNKLSRAIVSRLRNSGALIVIDEAQHLGSPALDQLRTIHDLAACGVVVSGNESVLSRLQGGEGRGAQFAQLYSRVGMRITQPKPRAKDVCAIVKAWGIDADSKEAELLKQIARKPGALRSLTKTMRLACMLAGGAQEPLSAKHIRQAWAQLSSVQLDNAA